MGRGKSKISNSGASQEVESYASPRAASKIEKNKRYTVRKYVYNGPTSNYGEMDGADLKGMLKGYKYDPKFGMWFSRRANITYDIQNVE